MTPARPMLAAVLAALTDTEEWRWWEGRRLVNAVLRPTATDVGWFWQDETGAWQPIPVLDPVGFGEDFRPAPATLPWITTDVAFAWEILQTRGLIPDEYVGRFFCVPCRASGWVADEEMAGKRCVCCDGRGTRPHPYTMPDLVAFLSLGFTPSDDGNVPGILGYEWIVERDIDQPFGRAMWAVGELPDADDGRPWCGIGVEVRDGCAVICVPPLWNPRPPVGTIVFPADGGLRVIDRDGNVVDVTTNVSP